MKRIIIFLVAFVTFTALFGGITASADSFVLPEPFARESEDGSRVFVFNPFSDEAFPAMGVYKNADPLELIYEISLGYMVFDSDFHFSDDMRSYVFVPTVSQNIAIEFYRDGILTHSYRIPNLVRDRRQVLYSVSMAFWHDNESRVFDSVSNLIKITTVDNLTYVFDVITGEVVLGEIIVTDEVWSPFNHAEETSPTIFSNVLDPEDLEFDLSEYITNRSLMNLPLDAEYITENVIPDKLQLDVPLIIGIIVIGIGAACIATTLILLKCRRKTLTGK